MNKTEMANTLASKTAISQVKALEIVNALFGVDEGILTQELADAGKVTIPGFGTFGSKTRAARVGTNPATGAKIKIASKKYVYFKPGKNLREMIEN